MLPMRMGNRMSSPPRPRGRPLPSHRANVWRSDVTTGSPSPRRSANCALTAQCASSDSSIGLMRVRSRSARTLALPSDAAAAPRVTHHVAQHVEIGRADVEHPGAELDVVAEHSRQLERHTGASRGDEQRHPVGRVAVFRRCTEILREPCRDHARTQHVFQRLAEPEVGRERDRGDDLRELDPGAHIRGPGLRGRHRAETLRRSWHRMLEPGAEALGEEVGVAGPARRHVVAVLDDERGCVVGVGAALRERRADRARTGRRWSARRGPRPPRRRGTCGSSGRASTP